MAKKVFNLDGVEQTATFIAGELETILNVFDSRSYMNRRIREAGPVKELTNDEQELANLRALNMVQLTITAYIAAVFVEAGWDEQEAEQAA
jgi:hypothetical protein